jgi:hypothetical protein
MVADSNRGRPLQSADDGAALALAAVAGLAAAQDFPTKPISLMVPFAAGGPIDAVARTLAQGMGKALKQSVIVENVVDAGGTIAPTKLKTAALQTAIAEAAFAQKMSELGSQVVAKDKAPPAVRCEPRARRAAATCRVLFAPGRTGPAGPRARIVG